jgi:murein DD-endopeptidase MepM/ murein hydrolase activator NlpD
MKVIPVGAQSLGAFILDSLRRSPFTRAMSLHEGIDFGVDAGSQVASTGDGVVADVRFNSTYGLMVDIEHSDRVVTRYAHLAKALVKVGQNISRGDVLGIVGSSGRSTGPHLHYEVRVDDKAQNPMRYIELAKRLLSIFA